MAENDTKRFEACLSIADGRRSQAQVARELNLSIRQIQRIYKQFKRQGLKGIVPKHRGRPSNNQLPKITIRRVLELVTCDLYSGFRPTFMTEKLEQFHGIKISRETTRKLMIEAGVWSGKTKKRPVVHPQRERRAHCGDLLQIDGSPHAWFEDRAGKCVLLVFIDDATGRTYGRFFESETTAAYMTTMTGYIKKYGKPLACYADRFSVFRVNQPGCLKQECLTQFGRALKELDIHLICATSPQAKGRVERANLTLQDRLVKELRLNGISTIEEANAFLEETYWKQHNDKFCVKAADHKDRHRKLLKTENLDNTLCFKEKRKVTKNLELQYKSVIYQISREETDRSIAHATVTILERLDGRLSIHYKGRELVFRAYHLQEATAEVSSKEIDLFLKPKKHIKPKYNDPFVQQSLFSRYKKITNM